MATPSVQAPRSQESKLTTPRVEQAPIDAPRAQASRAQTPAVAVGGDRALEKMEGYLRTLVGNREEALLGAALGLFDHYQVSLMAPVVLLFILAPLPSIIFGAR